MAVFKVSLSKTGECFTCDSGLSVLAAMAQLGRRGIPLGCRGGACGVCKVEVVSGCFQQRAMSRSHISEQDEREGRVLACRILPASDLELQVTGSMQRAMLKPKLSKQETGSE